MHEDRFRRIARRPERDHLPFGIGARRGPYLSPSGVRALAFLLGMLALAAIVFGAHP
jgi:hypothetical protein